MATIINTKNASLIRRFGSGLVAVIFLGVILSVGIFPRLALAAQLSTRSIEMSDSGVSAGSITSGVGSGTNVDYHVGFTVSNVATNIGGIAIDFCSNSPIVGDTCTAPTGFNANSSTTTINNQVGISGYTTYTVAPVANRIILTNSVAAAPTQANISFDIGNGTNNGVTNPSVEGSFYARIYTYTTATAAQTHNTSSPSGYTDYGGIATSTANVITITARVQETLLFCVSGAAPTANCGAVTTPAVSLGHGANTILDSTAVDTGNVYSQLSTNATSGAVVRMRNSAPSGGLNSGSNSIPAVNGGAGTSSTMTAGTAAFGVNVANGVIVSGSGGSGSVSADANYGPTGGQYGMDTTTAGGANVLGNFGDRIVYSTAPVNNINNTYTFAATAFNTTPSGVYTANISLIATGTF